ncbi:MAG: class I SAM-dependent methyltransferase [Abditibacteriales bacterium]|nr:class I SAM-dependent methyltransferase [Abditibacteriales bacterium]
MSQLRHNQLLSKSSKGWKDYYRFVYPQFWTQEARRYEGDAYYQALLHLITPAPGERVLECGIGTGTTLALPLAQRGANVHGVDIAEPLLRTCREAFAQNHLSVACVQSDVESLPYADESFDWVVCISTAWYLPDFPRAVGEMARVARRGGRVIFDIINGWHPFQSLMYLHGHLYQAVRRLKRKVQGRPTEGCQMSWQLRTPLSVRRALRTLNLRVQVKGFFVLLPLSLPLLGEKGNLCRFVPLLAFGLQDTPLLRYFGGKVVFVCEKL